jgi:hypothetical protein
MGISGISRHKRRATAQVSHFCVSHRLSAPT